MLEAQAIRDVSKLRKALGKLPEPVAKPFLIIVSGLPGTGKSYFSRRLAERLPALIVESDALRRALFPTPSHSPEESRRLFQASHLLIAQLLKEGIPIIMDATNLEERHREPLYHIADQASAKLIIVRVKAPPEVVRQRLEGRREGIDPRDKSRADWEVYRRMKGQVERIGRHHFIVDTSHDITPAIDKIVRAVRR